MLVVICREGDEQARAFARRRPSGQILLMTPLDLSTAGWRFGVPTIDRACAVIGGRRTSIDAIGGVLTRLAVVGRDDLPHIRPGDRDYVAAEMTAFLLSWLSSLSAPVWNRPVPPTLTSPCWRPERWAYAAGRLGLPLSPQWCTSSAWAPWDAGQDRHDTGVVTVVGPTCLGKTDEVVLDRARELARHVGAHVLAVRFDGTADDARLSGVSPWVDLTDGEVAEAILDCVPPGESP